MRSSTSLTDLRARIQRIEGRDAPREGAVLPFGIEAIDARRAREDWAKWLGEEPASDSELKALLAPCPDDVLNVWPVGKAVGNVRNDRADLVEPAGTT